MWSFLSAIWDRIRYFLGLILPALAKAKDFHAYSPQVRWVLRILVLSAILMGLGLINYYFLPGKKILDTGIPGLQDYCYLPLLFLIVYVLYWLVWWVLQIWWAPEEESPFPDIDKAWDEAMSALHNAGIDPSEVPLFLVLGRTADSEVGLMAASGLSFMVKQVPTRMDSPLRVYGNRDGVFVTCPGASLLGRQASVLAGEVAVSNPDFDPDSPFKANAPEDKTVSITELGSYTQEMRAILAEAQAQGRGPKDLTEDEQRRIQTLLAREQEEQAKKGGRSRPASLKSAAEIDRFKARLKHLCRLIVRERRPYCPANGILLTVPAAATEADEDAKQMAYLCQQDLRTAREVLEVHCPLFVLVCDLDTLPGFGEFIKRFPREQRQRRVGQRFPLLPDLEGSALEGRVEGVVTWICTALIPSWVYRLFRVERVGSDSAEAAVGGNVQLFRFMHQMRERRKRLARILTDGIGAGGAGPLMFGGCYLAGTGRAPDEHAFAAGVFQRLLQDQSYVSWTDAAKAAEANYQNWTRIGYAALAVSVIVLAALVYVAVKTFASA